MKPQKKFKIDWNKMEGKWIPVFRYSQSKSDIREIYTTFIIDDSTHMPKHLDYMNREGEIANHAMHKLISEKDETNSWFRMKFMEIPKHFSYIKSLVSSPIVKWFGPRYIVLNIDSGYNWCLMGEPCKQFAQLLQKQGTEELPQSLIEDNMEILRQNGYNFNNTKSHFVINSNITQHL